MRSFFKMTERFFIMIILNLLIMTMAMIVVSAVFSYLGISISDYPIFFWLIFYGVIGMGGSFFSLALSITFAKRAFKIQIIDSSLGARSQLSGTEQKLYQMVFALAKKAGLPKTPQVGIYQSNEVNAFATGPSKKKSLVTVSSALLSTMNDEELEGVLAHEVAHIANGDMVTMALVMGMVNTMVLLLAQVFTQFVTSTFKRRSFFVEYAIYMLFYSILNLLGSIVVVNVFSRFREYRADEGGARLAGKSKMIQALRCLQSITQQPATSNTAKYNAFKIASHNKKMNLMMRLLSTHPPLDMRIQKLERMRAS